MSAVQFFRIEVSHITLVTLDSQKGQALCEITIGQALHYTRTSVSQVPFFCLFVCMFFYPTFPEFLTHEKRAVITNVSFSLS